jgi:hypothetical protein
VLEKAATIDVLKAFRQIGQLKDLSKYTDDRIWQKLQERKKAGAGADQSDFWSCVRLVLWFCTV